MATKPLTLFFIEVSCMQIAFLVLPDCLIVILGWILYNKLHFSKEFFSGLEKLVYFILFPALLVRSIASTPMSLATTGNFLLATLALAIMGSLCVWLAKPVLKPRPIALASVGQCAYRFNTYIGLSLAPSLAGQAGLASMAVIVGFAIPFVNILAVKSLASHQGSNLFKEILKNPLVLATFAGLLLNFSGIILPSVLDTTLNKLGTSSIPLGLLCVGASLSLQGGSRDGKLVGWILAIRLGLMPVFAMAIAFALDFSIIDTQMFVLFAALPTASAAFILATRMGGDGRLVAFTISAGTILSVLTIPFWVYITQQLFN